MTPTAPPSGASQQSILEDLAALIRNLTDITASLADPAAAIARALSPQMLSAGSTNPVGVKAHPDADLAKRLRAAYGDAYGRLDAAQLVTSASSQKVTLTNAATDYVVQQPAYAKGVLFYAATHGSPSSGAQAYWSTSIPAAPLNQSGLAYDPNVAGGTYTGAPIIPGTLQVYALSDKAGPIHLASEAGGTVVLVGWLV